MNTAVFHEWRGEAIYGRQSSARGETSATFGTMQKKLQDANYKQQVEKWDTESDSDETDDEDLEQ